MRTPAWTAECRSAAEFYAALGPLRARRRRAEWRAASRHRGTERWGARGRCGPCGRNVEFSVENVRDDWDSVYREYLACPLCGLSNRHGSSPRTSCGTGETCTCTSTSRSCTRF